jgi:hypothetical protein
MGYRCDMPGDGPDGTCGRGACWFLEADGIHRPICANHDVDVAKVEPIDGIDPTKVPGWWKPQAAEPRNPPEAQTQGNPLPQFLIPVSSTPSRPPLREALEDVAVEFCEAVKRRLKKL